MTMTITTYPEPLGNLDLEKVEKKEKEKERFSSKGKVVRSNYLMEAEILPPYLRLRIGSGSQI